MVLIYKRTLNDMIMEKEEKELLERLVKEVATQNKLIAMLLSVKIGIIPNLGYNSIETQIKLLKEKCDVFLD